MSNQNSAPPKNPANEFAAAALRPAFASNAQAFSFLLLVAFAISLPFLITASGLISRRDSYEIMPEKTQPYSFIEKQIFDEKEDIDILFLGSSLIWAGIDAPLVQTALTSALGRPARVLTFGHSFNSIDVSYTQLRDLLEKRRVRMVVFSIPRVVYLDAPSATVWRFQRYGENRDLVDNLPFKERATLYANSILRSPHDLLTLVRKNRSSQTVFDANRGALKAEMGWGQNAATFERFNPPAPFITAENMIYSPAVQDRFEFTNAEIAPYQNYCLQKLVELLKEKRVPLAMINIPQHSESRNQKTVERKNWAQVFDMDIPLVGVQPAILFDGLNDEQVKLLYYNEHLNINGNEFFTRVVLPAILEIYEKHAAKN